ncbi:GNAT family N-acetyltransferase [Candidatus Daviesbacteria bacterium]|nr:GNAT family N-acetyltransferase [Candidatus Daviesbacteria bacterium]
MHIQLTQNLNKSELSQITNLHYQVLKESFINNFGVNFLKIAYKNIVLNPKNIFFILRERRKIFGFLVATEDDAQFNKSVIYTNFSKLILEILKSFIPHPLLSLKLIPWFFSSIRIKQDLPELKFIAINPLLQRRGWGSKLLIKLNNEFQKRGIRNYRVGTKSMNKNSNNFYKKSGFSFLGKKQMFGDSFNFYISPTSSNTDIILQPEKNDYKFAWILVIIFFIFFIIRSNITMSTVPFYDFDEAHRAENAKKMAEYSSFFVPLTGSSQDRVEHLKISLKENPILHLYYHLERPFLVYLSMILSTSIFGQNEWAYRLSSFIFGLSSILFLFIFIKFNKKVSIPALLIALVTLLTSSDLWLSSQYAQMDTAVTLFLFISLSLLVFYCQKKRRIYLMLSGISFALSVLSKWHPAIIILFPLTYLVIIKKLNLKEFAMFFGYTSLLLIPWLIYLVYRFGFANVILVSSGFALSSASIIDIHQKAPIFWYIRWWWESLRPGWSLFLALLIYDSVNFKISWIRGALLSYLFGGLIAFSLPSSKIWWYVLPLVPIISVYIYLSTADYLKQRNRLTRLSLIIILAAIPVFLETTNTIGLIYGFVVTFLGFFVLIWNIPSKKPITLLCLGLFLSLFAFYLRFPKIVPYHWNTKPVALFYKSLPGKNCLWIYDMPGEAVLFYSNAGEVNVYNERSVLQGHCEHHLMSASPLEEIYQLPNMQNKQILYQQGSMKLFKL